MIIKFDCLQAFDAKYSALEDAARHVCVCVCVCVCLRVIIPACRRNLAPTLTDTVDYFTQTTGSNCPRTGADPIRTF